jgi:hypothetical protein
MISPAASPSTTTDPSTEDVRCVSSWARSVNESMKWIHIEICMGRVLHDALHIFSFRFLQLAVASDVWNHNLASVCHAETPQPGESSERN